MLEEVKGPQNVIFESPCKPKWIERKTTRLKHQSEQFWDDEKPTKGGVIALPKFFELLLKVSYFSFQSILACRGSQKLHFGDLGLT